MLITAAGAAVAGTAAYYQPYGNYRTSPPTTLTERGYTGHHENRDIGLTYMNARYYIPGLGRFLTADTLVPSPANPQSHNRYSYVLGNPLVLVDPTGHASCYAHGQNEHCTDDTPMTPPPPRPQRPAVRPIRDIPQCDEGCSLPPPQPTAMPYRPTQEDYINWTNLSIAYARSILGENLSPEQLIAFLLYLEVGYLADNDLVLEAVTRQYNQYCSGGAWSETCITSFWGYYSPMHNLFNSPSILQPRFVDEQSLWGRYISHANQVTQRPELGGRERDRPFGWGDASFAKNPGRYNQFLEISEGSASNQTYLKVLYPGEQRIFYVLSPNQQAFHCKGTCTKPP